MSSLRYAQYLEINDSDHEGQSLEIAPTQTGVEFDMHGRTYRDRDNYDTHDQITMVLPVEDVVAVRDYLTELINELYKNKELG